MRKWKILLQIGLILLVALIFFGCQTGDSVNPILQVEEFGTYTTSPPTAQDDATTVHARNYPELRRKVEIYHLAFCEDGKPYNRFEREIRPHRRDDFDNRRRWRRGSEAYRYEGDRLRYSSEEKWEYLCAFNLNQNSDQMLIWLGEVNNQYIQDQEHYTRWVYSRHIPEYELFMYWCGKDSASQRFRFLETLKNRLVRLFPDGYLSYNQKIERMQSSLQNFCSNSDNVHPIIREISNHWKAVIYELLWL